MADPHQKKCKDRQLKVTPKAKTMRKKKVKYSPIRIAGVDAHGFVLLDKILKRDRQNEAITEIGAAEKKQRRAQHKRQNPFFFATGQPRRDKAPNLIKNIPDRKITRPPLTRL